LFKNAALCEMIGIAPRSVAGASEKPVPE